jgi:hypothetical protein
MLGVRFTFDDLSIGVIPTELGMLLPNRTHTSHLVYASLV